MRRVKGLMKISNKFRASEPTTHYTRLKSSCAIATLVIDFAIWLSIYLCLRCVYHELSEINRKNSLQEILKRIL